MSIKAIHICKINPKFVYILVITEISTKAKAWELYLEYNAKKFQATNMRYLLSESSYRFIDDQMYLYNDNKYYMLAQSLDFYPIHCKIIYVKNCYKLISIRNNKHYEYVIGPVKTVPNTEINPLKFWHEEKNDIIKCLYGDQIITMQKIDRAMLYESEVKPYQWASVEYEKTLYERMKDIQMYSML